MGIDEVASSIENAKHNSVMNSVKNTQYITGRCEKNIDELKQYISDENTGLYVVIDPARDGLHKKVRKYLQALDFDGLVYCSCNIHTWIRDTEFLCTQIEDSEQSIVPQRSIIVDMFPHTQHYEVLSSFIKR